MSNWWPSNWIPASWSASSQPQPKELNKLDAVKRLLIGLREANESSSEFKAETFQELYKRVSSTIENDPALARIAELAKKLTPEWSEETSKELTDEAKKVKRELKQAQGEKKRTRGPDAPAPEDPTAAKAHKAKKEKGAVRVLPLSSEGSLAHKAATLTKYAATGLTFGLLSVKAVQVGANVWLGNLSGAASDAIDTRFWSTVFGTGGAAATAFATERTLAPRQIEQAEPVELQDLFRDLTLEARQGTLYPVIGRVIEMQSCIAIFNDKNKPNVILRGPAGVGKTAIVEGLAIKIAQGEIPELKGWSVLSLSAVNIMADTKYRGQFETKLKEVIEMAENEPVIIFIDEIHNMMRAGAAEGAPSASDLLKPHLDRATMRCIGATTEDEYQLYIKSDEAFDRRFQPVPVGEPNVNQAIAMLRGRKDALEKHYGIPIPEDAIKQAVLLSHEFINDRRLPDKAIDIINKAASRISLALTSDPIELQQMRAKLIDEQRELENLQREGNPQSKDRIRELKKLVVDNKIEIDKFTKACIKDRVGIQSIQRRRQRLQEINKNLEQGRGSRELLKAEKGALVDQIQKEKAELRILKAEVDEAAIKEEIEKQIERKIP